MLHSMLEDACPSCLVDVKMILQKIMLSSVFGVSPTGPTGSQAERGLKKSSFTAVAWPLHQAANRIPIHIPLLEAFVAQL